MAVQTPRKQPNLLLDLRGCPDFTETIGPIASRTTQFDINGLSPSVSEWGGCTPYRHLRPSSGWEHTVLFSPVMMVRMLMRKRQERRTANRKNDKKALSRLIRHGWHTMGPLLLISAHITPSSETIQALLDASWSALGMGDKIYVTSAAVSDTTSPLRHHYSC